MVEVLETTVHPTSMQPFAIRSEVSVTPRSKIASVWPEGQGQRRQAAQGGAIETLEGRTHYQAGDYLVYEQPGQAEGAYAIKQAQFEDMYERLSDD